MMNPIVRQQRGTALVVVLLAVTLLTVVVVEFAYSTKVDYHLADNALKTLQANALARSGVNLAMLVLQRDTQRSGIDALTEEWARPLPALPIGEGVITVEVTDAQGKFNLNALRTANGAIDDLWREVAERLLHQRKVDPALLDPLLDWLDADDFPEPRGAEQADYRGLTPPLLPRNGPLVVGSELGRVKGFTPAIYARLAEVVTALPDHNTKINVNTAPADVLAALFPALSREVLEQLLVSRVATPLQGTNDLRDRLGSDASIDMVRLTTVRSEFFAIHARATVAPVTKALAVTVHRQAGVVTPISWQPEVPIVNFKEGD